MVCVFGQVRGGADGSRCRVSELASWSFIFPSLDGVNQIGVGGRIRWSRSSRVAIVGDGGNLDYLSNTNDLLTLDNL